MRTTTLGTRISGKRCSGYTYYQWNIASPRFFHEQERGANSVMINSQLRGISLYSSRTLTTSLFVVSHLLHPLNIPLASICRSLMPQDKKKQSILPWTCRIPRIFLIQSRARAFLFFTYHRKSTITLPFPVLPGNFGRTQLTPSSPATFSFIIVQYTTIILPYQAIPRVLLDQPRARVLIRLRRDASRVRAHPATCEELIYSNSLLITLSLDERGESFVESIIT